MNDRQRVEAILFPVFFQQILRCGASDQKSDEFRTCFLQLQQAIDLTLKGCDERKTGNLMRRAIRLHNEITTPYRGKVGAEKVGLVALYTLQNILAEDYLELEEGSDLAEAIAAIIRGLDHAFAKPTLDASAQKQAAKMLRELQTRGYYA